MNSKQGAIINTVLALSLCVGTILLVAGVITRVEFVFAGVPVMVIMILIGQLVLKKDPNNFYSRALASGSDKKKQEGESVK